MNNKIKNNKNNKKILLKNKYKKIFTNFLVYLKKSLKSFIVIIIIGLQIALLISYFYSVYKDKLRATEGIRDTLTYQGKITNADGVPPPDGFYNMRFRIYNQPTNGTLLWTETWDGTNQGQAGSKVQVTEGIFTVELNSLCGNWVGNCASNGGVTFATDSFYLQVELDYDGNGTFEEIFMPRKRFTATPYAMNADKLDGMDSLDFVAVAGDTMTGVLTVPKVIDSSLIAFYQFNGDAKDSSINTLDGILQNSPIVSNDILELDGTNQYVLINDNDLLSFGTGTTDNALSVSVWIKMTDATNFIILSKGVYNTNAEYRFFLDANDKVNFQLFDESVADCYIGRLYDTALTDYQGEWLNLIATYDGSASSSGIKIYLNGNRVDDTNSANNAGSYVAMENLTADLYLGRYDTNYAKGALDDLKIINRELSADEVKSLYESEKHSQIQVNKITTHTLYLSYVNEGETSGSYLTWDPIFSRIKINNRVYTANSLPYLGNRGSQNDYTHYTDANKILAYDFSDSVGTTVTDLAENADGTLNGDADWTNLGYIGYGIEFDGNGDSISFTDPGLSSIKGSVEMWVRLNDVVTSANNYLIKMSQSASNEIVIAKQNAADLIIKVGNSGEIDTNFNIPDTNWHHVVLTWNAGDIEVFIDGSLIKTASYSTLDVALFTNFYLASAGSANTSLNGSLDSVAIYDDVLTLAEIKNHYNSAFYNLAVSNYLSDGNINATLDNIFSMPAYLNEENKADPVYFSNDTKVVGLSFSEGRGLTTMNVTGNDNPTISGANWHQNGFFGYGLEFDGHDDFLTINDSANINVGTGDFSIEFYLKGDGSTVGQSNKRIISKRSGNTGYEVYFDANDKITFFIGDGSTTFTANVSGGADISDGYWHHVLIIFNREGNAIIYYDGSLIYSQDITSVSGSLDNTADLYIGKDGSGNYYKGILDSILIYKSQVNIADVLQRKTSGLESLVIYGRSFDYAPLLSLSGAADKEGLIAGILNTSNTTGYPLKLINDASYTSGSNTIYNFIAFNDSSGTSFGNLIWDDTNSQFIFDQSLKTTNDLTADYIRTIGSDSGDNEFLAHDIIRHTVTAGEVLANNFTESWSKAITKKIVLMKSCVVDEDDVNDTVYCEGDWWTSGPEQSIIYNGSTITVNDLANWWTENDIVTIYIVYEK